jgi:hypothetical protein
MFSVTATRDCKAVDGPVNISLIRAPRRSLAVLDAEVPKGPPQVVTERGPLNGPSYAYRGATINGNAAGSVFQISLPGTPLDGWKGICDLAVACSLIDASLEPAPTSTIERARVEVRKPPEKGKRVALDRLYTLLTGKVFSHRHGGRTLAELVYGDGSPSQDDRSLN